MANEHLKLWLKDGGTEAEFMEHWFHGTLPEKYKRAVRKKTNWLWATICIAGLAITFGAMFLFAYWVMFVSPIF